MYNYILYNILLFWSTLSFWNKYYCFDAQIIEWVSPFKTAADGQSDGEEEDGEDNTHWRTVRADHYKLLELFGKPQLLSKCDLDKTGVYETGIYNGIVLLNLDNVKRKTSMSFVKHMGDSRAYFQELTTN